MQFYRALKLLYGLHWQKAEVSVDLVQLHGFVFNLDDAGTLVIENMDARSTRAIA